MIGIIAAMRSEVDEMLKLADHVKQIQKASFTFWQAQIDGHDIVIMLSGVGKGYAAMATTLLIQCYQPRMIINIGTAGGLCANEEVLDIVIGTHVVQHDYDTSAVDGEQGIGLLFSSDAFLCEQCKKVCDQMKVRNHIGLIASGDQFIADEQKVNELRKQYPSALCAEMEAGAIAQVATCFQIPFVIIRSLSDIAVRKDNQLTFREYVCVAASRSAKMCLAIIKEAVC